VKVKRADARLAIWLTFYFFPQGENGFLRKKDRLLLVFSFPLELDGSVISIDGF